MGLDFNYTCPRIDREINKIKSTIENNLEDYIKQLCPLMSNDTIYDLRSKWATELYDDIELGIKIIRQTNEDMRSQADKQIINLEDEISELKSEISLLT